MNLTKLYNTIYGEFLKGKIGGVACVPILSERAPLN